LLRRSYEYQEPIDLKFGPYHFKGDGHVLLIRGESIPLQHRDYRMALYLFLNSGRLLSRETLVNLMQSRSCSGNVAARSLDTFLSRLRGKLKLSVENGFLLTAVHGLGYRMEQLSASH